MNITQEQLDAIKSALQFYIDRENYEWDGCSCHGHYNILDRGEKAEDGMNVIQNIEQDEADRIEQETWDKALDSLPAI